MLDGRHDTASDQAAGLRRLFGARAAQVIAFVAARAACGRTTLLVQTAAALAQSGHGVVIIDENRAPENAHSAFGVKPRHDLIDLVHGGRSSQQIMQAVAPRLRVVAAARFAAEVLSLDALAAASLDAGLQQLQQDAAFVLVDCAAGRSGHVSPLALNARHLAVVVAAQGAAITDAYALIKRLARESRREGFQVVITRARGEDEAQAIFDNLQRTAREHLGVRLDYLGGCRVPQTDHLADALQSRLPLGAAGSEGGGFLRFALPPVVRGTVSGRKRLESVV